MQCHSMFQNAIEGKMQSAQDWLQDPAALVGSAGTSYYYY